MSFMDACVTSNCLPADALAVFFVLASLPIFMRVAVKVAGVSAWGPGDWMSLATYGRNGAGQNMWSLTADQMTNYFKIFGQIQSLNLKWDKKSSLMAMFSSGLFKLATNLTWSIIEIGVGVFTACAPDIRQFFRVFIFRWRDEQASLHSGPIPGRASAGAVEEQYEIRKQSDANAAANRMTFKRPRSGGTREFWGKDSWRSQSVRSNLDRYQRPYCNKTPRLHGTTREFETAFTLSRFVGATEHRRTGPAADRSQYWTFGRSSP
ncbi:hypothetical protein BDP67DRAFT_490421 [Colletotrichum lupini]|nr:hypothetical protein BDP67DRAFT_490421 [Colletotrichum lupini]